MKEHLKKHKVLYTFLFVLFILIVFLIIQFGIPYVQRHFATVQINENQAINGEKINLNSGNILTVYFTRVGNTDFESDVDAVSSASLMKDNDRLIGNSELLAKMINNSVGGDLYAIKTKKKYPSSYSDTVNEASKENSVSSDLELLDKLPDVKKYDTVFIVYPVWWGTLPKAVISFLNQVDFKSKTIYSVATHGGSGIANSVSDLSKATNGVVKTDVLSIYDRDVASALPLVTDWLKSLKKQ